MLTYCTRFAGEAPSTSRDLAALRLVLIARVIVQNSQAQSINSLGAFR
jgi:hypothetical protein